MFQLFEIKVLQVIPEVSAPSFLFPFITRFSSSQSLWKQNDSWRVKICVQHDGIYLMALSAVIDVMIQSHNNSATANHKSRPTWYDMKSHFFHIKNVPWVTGEGKRLLHSDLICTYTLPEYKSNIYVDGFCTTSVKNLIVKSRRVIFGVGVIRRKVHKKYFRLWVCDQSNYSSRIILSHIPAKWIHLKFSKMTWGRLLDLVQPEVDPYNTPTPKITLVPNM